MLKGAVASVLSHAKAICHRSESIHVTPNRVESQWRIHHVTDNLRLGCLLSFQRNISAMECCGKKTVLLASLSLLSFFPFVYFLSFFDLRFSFWLFHSEGRCTHSLSIFSRYSASSKKMIEMIS
jgi:hypothetical protein